MLWNSLYAYECYRVTPQEVSSSHPVTSRYYPALRRISAQFPLEVNLGLPTVSFLDDFE